MNFQMRRSIKKVLEKTNLWLAMGLLLFFAVGCIGDNPLEELQFNDPQTEERFLALDACIREYIREESGWHSIEYVKIPGNDGFEDRWCRGAGTLDDCKSKSSRREKRDQHSIRLARFYDSDEEMTFSKLGLYVLKVPAEGGWAVYFSFHKDKISSVSFWYNESAYYDPEEEIERVYIGTQSYRVFEQIIRTPDLPALSSSERLEKVLESPESMRDLGILHYQIIADEVARALKSGEIHICDYPEYEGDGIPPMCTPRPFTDDELAYELAQAENYFANQQSILEENYIEMYNLLFEAFPFDRCQP